MNRVLVIGSGGQDGTLLRQLLQSRGVEHLGLTRRGVVDAAGRVQEEGSLLDADFVLRLLKSFSPGHVFYLAAHHHSSQDTGLAHEANLWRDSLDVQVNGLIHVLEASRQCGGTTRVFYASSSHIFGATEESPQSETTPPAPDNVYAITKVAGMNICRYYRRHHGIFAATGIFYNHESAYRKEKFLSQKIIRGTLAIKRGRSRELLLGDLSSRVDWGYAPDYVEAATRILGLAQADDYIIATGETHSVRDFVQMAFEEQGLDYREFAKEKPGLVRPGHGQLAGDAAKLRRDTGWQPTVSFREMIARLTRETCALYPELNE